ncbi:MAG: terminase family protein, partial [Alteraurantiacibacter sp.]
MAGEERDAFLAELPDDEQDKLQRYWPFWSRANQMPPGGDWRVWLICAGRGFGKTRAGAEWVRHIAQVEEEARFALVASSLGEARQVMVEGESGILACCRNDSDAPYYEPSLRRLTWPSGAQATLFSAGEPESLRGPQHSHAWCDEIAKWDNSSERAMSAWDNLQLGLRLGDHPQVCATTTPRAVSLMRRLAGTDGLGGGDPDIVVTRGSTYDNVGVLNADFVASVRRQYGRSALGRQELDGELLADVEGALWTRSLIERCREECNVESLVRIVVGVDPPASARGDECGIVVAGVTANGRAKVVADASIRRPSP